MHTVILMGLTALQTRLARLEAQSGTTMSAEQRRKLQEAIIASIVAGPTLNLAMPSHVAPALSNNDQHTGQLDKSPR